jgi:kynureninase
LPELLDYRERFPILESTTYLINHSLGAMPAEARVRLARYADEWATRGARAWGEGWWDAPFTVGDLLGSIIGAPAGSVVMHQNVTVAEAVVLSCFAARPPRNRVVFEAGLFPSVRYVQQAWARYGAEVVVCDDADAVIDAIDERTLLVPVSHVLFKTAEIQPVERVVARAHEVGALVCLDAYQSTGAVPLDVTALDLDFCVGGSVKWLCGGPGAGWLYVRPDLAERLEPAFSGWQAHARPFAFEPEMAYATGAARFLTGTPNVPALYAASAGYEIVAEVGVERIRARSLDQTALLISLIDERGWELVSPRGEARRGGSVVFRVPDFEAVQVELARRNVICDARPDAGLRFGPHFFNTDDEIRFAVDQVAEILESGAHLARAGAVAGY